MSLGSVYFPEKLAPLFQPKRKKVLYGGRGAGRSWGIGRALLLKGVEKPLRVLCARELQNSVAESVHKVLKSQIEHLGLEAQYSVQRDKIYGVNGTEFSFEGIKNNPTKVKSYEGIDICWVEEADAVTEESWDILLPTIRKKDSEIWISFNPQLETDYTYKHFVLEAGEDTVLIYMTWQDNEFFPQVLYEEMAATRAKDEDKYLNIWMGKPRQMLDGAVYAKELRRALTENRITTVRWERDVPISTFWDLGKRDHTSIWFAQRVAMQYRIVDFLEARQEDLPYYIREIQRKPYSYAMHWLPHDAAAKKLGSLRTIEEQLRQHLKHVRIVPKQRIADGIAAVRSIMDNCWFDELRTMEGLKHLKAYKFAKGKDGLFSKEPLHDEHSDAADAFRQLALALSPVELKTSADERSLAERLRGVLGSAGAGVSDWMRN